MPTLKLLDYLWRGDHYITPGTGNSQGCVTLVSPPYKIIRSVDIGQRGHVLGIAKHDINKVDLIIVNIYAPNGHDNSKISFFNDVLDRVSEVQDSYDCERVILAGDLNVVLEANEVLNRKITQAEERVASAVKDVFNQLNVSDGWQEVNDKSYTWSSNRTGVQSYSTLDRICYNKSALKLLTKRCDWAMSLSDHAAVIARFSNLTKLTENSQKLFIPRLDARLLDDSFGRPFLIRTFNELLGQMDDSWNPHVKLEYCKMCIRSASNIATG